jgi:hypothetical protein
MKPLQREMKLLGYHFRLITGFKFQFSGRLVRRDRSRVAFLRGGSLPASTYMRYAEHAFTLSYLRNGACSIRVCYIVQPLRAVQLVIHIEFDRYVIISS